MQHQRPTSTALVRQTDGTLRLAPSRESRRRERVADTPGALQLWLSRSQSSVHSAPGCRHGLGAPSSETLLQPLPPQSRSSVWEGKRSASALPGRTRLDPSSARKDQKSSGLGRPTKSSTLRLHSCPEARVMPNYSAIANKRKNFERRHRNFSTSAILSSSIPKGESLHSFITGARYNSAHIIDSRSLECLGVYIPRQDVSRIFVNPAGITPPSQAVFGRRHHQDGGHDPRSLSPVITQSVEVLTHTLPLENDSSTQDIDQVFGPDEGSSDSETSLRLLESETVIDAQMSTSSIQAAASREDFDLPHTTQPSVSKTTHQDALPFSPLLRDAAPVVLSTRSGDFNQASRVHEPKQDYPSSMDPDQPLDFISPEAQRITDEILTEAQNSCSSLTSSMKSSHLSTSTPSLKHTPSQKILSPSLKHTPSQKTVPPSPSPSPSSPLQSQQWSALPHKLSHPTTASAAVAVSVTATVREGGVTDDSDRPLSSPLRQPGSAGPSDAQLVEEERSSSIFIDLSGLQRTQKSNNEESDSEDSGSV